MMKLAGAGVLALGVAACAIGGAEVRQLTAEDYLQRARDQMAQKHYEEAKTVLEEARSHFRAADLDAELISLLGDAEFGLGDYPNAAEVYGEFMRLHPRNYLAPKVQYQAGMCYLNMLDSCDRDPLPAYRAKEAFSRVLKYYGRSPEAEAAAAQLAVANRHLAGCEMVVGQFYFRKQNYRGAIGRFELILKEYPEAGLAEETLYLLGQSYLRLEEREKAREYFRALVERFPGGRYTGEARDFLGEGRS